MKKLFTCFLYGEGKRDKKFLNALVETENFKDFIKNNWAPPAVSNYHGCSAKDILDGCCKEINGQTYDLIICFIDLDDLKSDFPKDWENKKCDLEERYYTNFNIIIIWQIEKAEDEYIRVLGNKYKNKKKKDLNKIVVRKINSFIGSKFYKKIIKIFQEKEKQLKSLESMQDKINYKLSENGSSDSKILECIIGENKLTKFEFTYELLSQENFRNLTRDSSPYDFYKAIENFLFKEIKSNNLKDLYLIKSDNFINYL